MSPTRVLLPGLLAGWIALATAPLGAEEAVAVTCRAPLERWTQVELYFGRDIQGGGEVSESQFQTFLAHVVTPRFPEGLTVTDVSGQFRQGQRLVREKAKLLILMVPDALKARPRITAIVERYKARFRQESVLRIETPICLAF